jgi:hypothetical protein
MYQSEQLYHCTALELCLCFTKYNALMTWWFGAGTALACTEWSRFGNHFAKHMVRVPGARVIPNQADVSMLLTIVVYAVLASQVVPDRETMCLAK